ncbi:MAG TPA: DUF5753 domain-containing protein, partial [Actinophytocola sp.]|nr:DUF5753 domain-containing protein [Actinophytocola sp.]
GAATRDLLAMCPQDDDHQGYFLSREGDWLPSSLNALIFHESMATGLVLYEPMVVNGLLQTGDYARSLMTREQKWTSEEIESAIRVRNERKQILNRPAPARFTFFMHEQALRNMVCSSKVMHDQLLFLVLVAALHNVTLRVVPCERVEQGALGGPFQMMTFHQHRPLVYLDQLETGLFLEEEEFVAPYRDRQVALLADLAWDAGQSREFVASLATEFDRGSRTRHGGIYQLEEEQL